MSGGDPLARLEGAELDVGAAVRALRDAFAAAGLDGATAEARFLVGRILALDLTGLTVGGTRPVDRAAAVRLATAARRRLAGEPVQRIVGAAGFFGRDFALDAATLVPRPDTETLIEVVLDAFAPETAFVFADLGVGSGAILVTLLAERPRSVGVATDLSEAALAMARTNAEHHGVAGRAQFVRGSYGEALAPAAYDAVVSNPPYIASAEIEALDAEVRLHDPRLALDGGDDGLAAYRAIAPQAARALKPGGFLAVEIGWRQAADVAAILAEAGYADIVIVRDLAGRDRVVSARSRPEAGGRSGRAAGHGK